jgi:hypothetical protein
MIVRSCLSLLVVALLSAGCGDGDDDTEFISVPLQCDTRVDALADAAERWPDPATLNDLRGVNSDVFATLNGLGSDCEDGVFARLDEIECDYLTAVEGADEEADAFLASQQSRCEDDPVPEADPDEPTATIETDGASTATTVYPCGLAREELESNGIIPTPGNMPPGCPV